MGPGLLRWWKIERRGRTGETFQWGRFLFVCLLIFLTFYFEIIVHSHAIIRNNMERSLCPLFSFPTGSDILRNHSIVSPPGQPHSYNRWVLFRFHWFCMCSFEDRIFICITFSRKWLLWVSISRDLPVILRDLVRAYLERRVETIYSIWLNISRCSFLWITESFRFPTEELGLYQQTLETHGKHFRTL